jgi:SAM-dependent methyltransferase
LIWVFVDRWLDRADGSLRVLHFAPNRGLYDRLAADPRADWLPVDPVRRESVVFADVQRLPFRTETFDLVICSHVLEHVPDDSQALGEIRRVLSPEGRALVLVPLNWNRETDEAPDCTDPVRRRERFCQADHVRVYGHDITSRFKDAGLTVTITGVPEFVERRDRFRYGLNPAESCFVCVPKGECRL